MTSTPVLSEVSTYPGARILGQDFHGANTREVVDPATQETVAHISWVGEDVVDAAVEAAVAVRASWAETPARVRGDALRAIAAQLRQEVDRIAPIITAESGKRLAEAQAEVKFSADYFDWFAEAAAEAHRGEQRTNPQRRFLVHRHPVGVVAALGAWNFPLSIPARKIAAALAAGCPVVLKPSELTPLSASELVRICEAHLPAGLVSLVIGDGATLSNALVDHPDVAAVTFTGSTQVGALVASRAASTFTRTTLELGGKAPFIVRADADPAAALEALLIAKFRNNGESCIAANNVYVHDSLYPELLSALVARVQGLHVGDPRNEATDVGPLIQASSVDRLRFLIEEAEEAGCRVWRGGPVPLDGHYLEPTVVEVLEDTKLSSDEIFGPVCAIRPFTDEDDLVNEINSWGLGLAGYVCGSDSEGATSLAQRLRVGIVGVNNGAPNTPEVPFGGFGASGIGREGGMTGLCDFTEEQTISIAR